MSEKQKNANVASNVEKKIPQMMTGGSFPTNQDLADILERTDLHAEDFLFDFLNSRFPDFLIFGLGPRIFTSES